jgi:acetyl-CoA acetyltransferase
MERLRNKACIIGAGQTELSRDSGRSVQRLAVEAALAAIADAGLETKAIDGIVPFPVGPTAEDLMAGLGLDDCKFSAVPHMGGASSVAALRLAAIAVESGAADAVLVFVARNGRSEGRVDQRVAVAMPGQQFRSNLEHPQGLSTPAQWYSMICRRHMHEYGTTREQLGSVALTMRGHANLNPRAQMYTKPLTLEQYLDSPVIADPYHLFDCCLETDGASAVIVANPSLAAHGDAAPVYISGVAEGHADSPDDLSNRVNFFNIGLTKAAPRAFAMAGMTPEDIDFAQIYDCFTFEVVHQLEEAGFCERGGGGDFVSNGGIALGGSLPVNPNGGLLSEGHLGGMNNVFEAVAQLRGQSGERQVPNAHTCALTGWGDLGDGAMAILTA